MSQWLLIRPAYIYMIIQILGQTFFIFSNTCSQEKCYYLSAMYIYVFPEFRTTKMKKYMYILFMQYYRRKSLIFSYFFYCTTTVLLCENQYQQPSSSLSSKYLGNEISIIFTVSSASSSSRSGTDKIKGMNKEIFLFVLLAMSIPHLIDVHH